MEKMKKIKAGLVSVAAGCWTYGPDEAATLKDIECVFQVVFNYAIRFAGLAVFIMLLVGGIKFLTAGGEPEKAASAQKTLTYAVFGLVLIIVSWFVLLLISEFTGIELTTFEIVPATPLPSGIQSI